VQNDPVSKLERFTSTVGTLGAAGAVIAGCLVFGEDGRLQQVKLGPLPLWDRKRRDARRAARATRK
jgi:hypothetical protein